MKVQFSMTNYNQGGLQMNDSDIFYIISSVRDAARAEILPRFRNIKNEHVQVKSSPNDLVTFADKAVEAYLTNRFADKFKCLIVGEEAVSGDPSLRFNLATRDRVIVIDPIDGTKSFVDGFPVFGVMVSVCSVGLLNMV